MLDLWHIAGLALVAFAVLAGIALIVWAARTRETE